MTSKDFFKEVRTSSLKRCYLLHGVEEYAKERGIEALTARIDESVRDFNVDILDAPTADQVIETARTWPMMSDLRIVLVKNSNFFAKSEKEAKEISAFLPEIPECVCLAFIHRDSVDMRKALVKAINKEGAVVDFERYSENEAAQWAAGYAKKRGVEMDITLAYKLVSMTGRLLIDVVSELTKLIDYIGDRKKITESDLDALVHANTEYTVFEMLEHFLAGRMAKGLALLDASLQEDEKGAAISLIGFFASRLRQMLKAREAMDEGKVERQIVQILGGNSYAAKKTIASAKRFDKKSLENALLMLADADYASKNGIEAGADALRRVLVTVFA